MTIDEKLAQLAGSAPAVDPASVTAVPQKNDPWGNLGAGSYSALNEGLMGLPDFLVKNIGGSENYQALKKFRDEHKLASDIGGGAGLIGSLFIPGGAVAKGLGAGLKVAGAAKAGEALGKAGEFLGEGTQVGDKIGKLALRGAGQAAEQAVPRALTNLDYSSPDNFAQSAKDSLSSLGTSLGVGAGAGALLGRASQLLGKSNLGGTVPEGAGDPAVVHALGEARKLVNNQTLASAGLETRAVRQAARVLGLKGARAGSEGDDYVADVANGIRTRNINSKKDWDALVDDTRNDWQKIDQGFADNAPQGWNTRFADEILNDPELLARVNEAGASKPAADALLDIAYYMTQNPGLGPIRNKLNNLIRAGIHSNDPGAGEQGRLAAAIKDKFDDFVGETSGRNVVDAKAKYKLVQPFLMQEGKDVLTVGKPLGDMGSPTGEKGLGGVLGGAVAQRGATGLGLGGLSAAGDVAQGNDVDWTRAGLGATAGVLAGPVAINALRQGINKLTSKGVRKLGAVLEGDGADQLAAKAGEGAQKALGGGAPLVSRGGALTLDPNTLQQVKPPVADGKVDTAPNEPGSENQGAPAAAPNLPPQFRSVLANRLQFLHDNYYSDMAPDQFMAAVQAKTKNFSDFGQMADLLYSDPEQRSDFARQYQSAQTLKGLDIDKALGALAGANVLGFKPDEQGFKARETLKDLIVNNITKGDIKGRPAAEKEAERYIEEIRRNPALLATLKAQLTPQNFRSWGIA